MIYVASNTFYTFNRVVYRYKHAADFAATEITACSSLNLKKKTFYVLYISYMEINTFVI